MSERLIQTIIITFLIGTGLWLFYFSWDYIDTSQRLEKNSAVVEGRVISNSSYRLSRGGHSYSLVVEYIPAGHAAITKNFDVGGTTFNTAVDTRKVNVTYHPEKPEISLITQFEVMPFKIILGLAVFMLIAGLFLIWRVINGNTKH